MTDVARRAFPVKGLSLTAHLGEKKSPVRQYFDEAFPKTRGFPKEMRARLSGAAMIEPPADMSPGELGLVGTALDYRIRYYFAAESATGRQSVAASGLLMADVLDGLPPEQLACYEDFLESHDRYIADLKPHGRLLGRADEEELNRRCVVLAMFEQLYRMGLFAIGKTWLHRAPLDPLSIPEQDWIDDLCRMSEAFYTAMRERLNELHHLNPVFDGSIDMSGADADLIIGRTLFDIKTKQDPASGLKQQLYQMLGYALLDYSDTFGLEKLGLYFARYGVSIEWTIEALLEQIGAPHSLEGHREELQALLQGDA